MIGLSRDEDIPGAVRASMAALSDPDAAQRLRSALVSTSSPLTLAWLAEVGQCLLALRILWSCSGPPLDVQLQRKVSLERKSPGQDNLRMCNAALGLPD